MWRIRTRWTRRSSATRISSSYSRIQRGTNLGFYGYAFGGEARASAFKYPPIDKRGPLEGAGFDRSNSQYGVLGAWALEQAGAEIPVSFWKEEDQAWRKAQVASGGWITRGTRKIADDDLCGHRHVVHYAGYILQMNSKLFDTTRAGCPNTNIDRGLAWMDKHIQRSVRRRQLLRHVRHRTHRRGERPAPSSAPATGISSAADLLVKHQQPNGSYGTVHDTAFAILFNGARARLPVMMNKLIYADPAKTQVDPWNERPRDTANLGGRWMGKHSVEGFFNWQVVKLDVPVEQFTMRRFCTSPAAGSSISSEADIAKLRAFIEQGGMILGNADGGNGNFAPASGTGREEVVQGQGL